MQSRRGSLGRRLVFGLIVTFALFGVVEIGARAVLGPPPPAVQVYTAVGETDSYFTVTNGVAKPTYQFWEPVDPFLVETDTPRVAFLGGSSVHGGSRNLSTAQEFPALVGQRTGIEVLNLATPSLDSHDTVRIVEELAKMRFTAIAVYDGHNDFGNIYFNARYTGATAASEARIRSFLEHFRLYTALRGSIREGAGGWRLSERTGKEAVSAERREMALQGFEANLRRVAWLAKKAGIKLILGTPASCLQTRPGEACIEEPCAKDLWEQSRTHFPQDPEGGAQLLSDARDHDPIPLRATSAAIQAVRDVAADEGAILVDPVKDLPIDRSRMIPDCSLFTDNVHFNERGHQAMAELFAPAVEQAVGGK